MKHQTITIPKRQPAKNIPKSELLEDIEKSLEDIRHGRVIRVR